ncbi:MAG: SUMF1/EgtB/PvdO family nonheme iron enzyme [Polyangiaceae bacterium]
MRRIGLISVLLLACGCDVASVETPAAVATAQAAPKAHPRTAVRPGKARAARFGTAKRRRGGARSAAADGEATAGEAEQAADDASATAASPGSSANAATASDDDSTNAATHSASCPEGMARVEGEHCRSVEQPCLEYVHDAKHGPDKTRCAKFGPSVCTDPKPRRKMSFCMDVHEYPNKVGELPMTLVSWTDAARLCDVQGKRLCTESEFTFACEGESMQPYATGFTREADKCNIDHPYVTPKKHLKSAPLCEVDPACTAEMKRVDGRRPIGESDACASPFGIIDMNGNANEWVSRPWKDPPHRAAIKGGWWGPVRNRCRAITAAHDETYHGYEVGFRCCKGAD